MKNVQPAPAPTAFSAAASAEPSSKNTFEPANDWRAGRGLSQGSSSTGSVPPSRSRQKPS